MKNTQSIVITINTTSDAFVSDLPEFEVARILRTLAADLEYGRVPSSIQDINGNTVGNVSCFNQPSTNI
jgi:hypothetical protein